MTDLLLILLRTVLTPLLLIALLHPRRRGIRHFRAVRRGIDRLAARPRLAVVAVGLLAFLLSAMLSLAKPPVPHIHDEFSYLLAGDTFGHGRVTNPPHPMWQHFETFQVIFQPTYASKYPPAQGVALAVGQVLTGSPLVGVWLSVGLACAAITWMLQGWLSRRWALWGGLLAALQLTLYGTAVPNQSPVGYWSQSYWGGAVAAAGGALLFGAARRLVRRPRAADALLLALGLVILANSRPFEGLVASLPVAVLLLAWLIGKRRPPLRVSLGRVVAPVLAVLVAAGAAMAYYNARVTGDPLLLPFELHERTYGVLPLFLWQPLRPEQPQRHEVIRDFYAHNMRDYYTRQQTIAGFLHEMGRKGRILWTYFLGPALTVPLLALPWALRQRWTAFALLVVGVLLAAMLATPPIFPHYVAPVTGLVFLLVVQSARHLRLWLWRPRRRQARAVALLRGACVAMLPFAVLVAMFLAQREPPPGWGFTRARLLAELRQKGGRHLVIVSYGPTHNPNLEWVYNEADIDASAVVWARDMGPEDNRELIEYYRDRQPERQVWRLAGDERPVHLEPYYP
jgi:hypothetical protein